MEDWEIIIEFLRNAVVPIVTALVTVWLVHRYESKRIKSEQDEKIVRQLFERYVNALTETYEAMCACYDVLKLYAISPPQSPEEYKSKVLVAREKWERVEQKNALWLKEVEEEISVVRGEFRLISMAIFDAIGRESVSFNREQEFSNAYFVARDALRDLIPISSLEKKLKELSQQTSTTGFQRIRL